MDLDNIQNRPPRQTAVLRPNGDAKRKHLIQPPKPSQDQSLQLKQQTTSPLPKNRRTDKAEVLELEPREAQACDTVQEAALQEIANNEVGGG